MPKHKPKHRRYPRQLAFKLVLKALNQIGMKTVPDKYLDEVKAVVEAVRMDMKYRLRNAGGDPDTT